jgi:hypothetical protein
VESFTGFGSTTGGGYLSPTGGYEIGFRAGFACRAVASLGVDEEAPVFDGYSDH